MKAGEDGSGNMVIRCESVLDWTIGLDCIRMEDENKVCDCM